MEGHPYLIKGIPKALWKEFRLACIYFDTTAKDHLMSCMQQLVILYHRRAESNRAGPIYESKKEKKK